MKTRIATVALGFGALLIPSSPVGAQDDWQKAYSVGDRVELRISGAHWQQCVVTENTPGGLMRGRCEEYVERAPGTYRRAGGIYILYKGDVRPYGKASPSSAGLPPLTVSPQGNPRPGPTGPIAAKASPRPAEQSGAAGLKVGEYACYGSGGRILAGLGFRVLPGNRFTDLDGGNAGSYSVSGSTVAFRGGHLGGQTGRDLRNYNFRIGAQATCEPF